MIKKKQGKNIAQSILSFIIHQLDQKNTQKQKEDFIKLSFCRYEYVFDIEKQNDIVTISIR